MPLLNRKLPATPDTVVKHGWRDERYNGVDQCGKCHGWGALAYTIGAGKERKTVHRTCERCRGRGHT